MANTKKSCPRRFHLQYGLFYAHGLYGETFDLYYLLFFSLSRFLLFRWLADNHLLQFVGLKFLLFFDEPGFVLLYLPFQLLQHHVHGAVRRIPGLFPPEDVAIGAHRDFHGVPATV